MRRDVPEVQVGREPARAVRVGVVVFRGVSSELRRYEPGEAKSSCPLAAGRVSRRDVVVDWQVLECRLPFQQARGRPAIASGYRRRSLRLSRQGLQRFLGELAQVRPELALDERAKRSRGREHAAVGCERMSPFESTASTRTALCGSRYEPRDEEGRIVVGDDDAGVLRKALQQRPCLAVGST